MSSKNPRVGGRGAHEAASPKPRSEPNYRPRGKTKFGHVRCPRCTQWWTGLSWGDACPACGTVRMHEGNWWPFEETANTQSTEGGPE